MKKLFLIFSILLLSVCIYAQRSFIGETGHRFFFISKGETQSALGINDAGLQNIYNRLDWQYYGNGVYDVIYGWSEMVNGELVDYTGTNTIYVNIGCNVDSKPRLNPQSKVTGFDLYFDQCKLASPNARPVVGDMIGNKQILSFRIVREEGIFRADGYAVKEWYINTVAYELPYDDALPNL